MPSREEIWAHIEAGASLDELLQKTMRPELAQLIDRCAWVRFFDAEVLDILRDGKFSDVTFEEVVASPDIRPVSNREATYRVRRAAREAALLRLAPGGEVPESLCKLSGRLAKHFAERNRSLDALDQLIVANPDDAVDLLRDLYAKADKDFDTPRCQTILDVVRARGSLSNWKLVREQNRLERYLVARAYWRERYRKASRFLVPRGTEEAFTRLLADAPPHTLHIFGMGGMGKTFHLYELIARRAVPEPRRLAAALVDFDLVQLGNVLREPWLLLIELAHQLNQQLPEPLFDDFLKQYSRLRARLLMPQFAVEASVPGQMLLTSDEQREQLQENVREEFYRLSHEPADAGKVLIAFDTLEVVTGADAASCGAPERLLDELGYLRRRLACARLVLSGRFDLQDQVADIDERLGPVEHLELHRLDAGEATEYLQTRRKLRLDDERLEAAMLASGARNGGAQPLVLAMIADSIADQPDISPTVIRTLDEPRLFNLIERIVLRIPDNHVRWLLRYGVVPRFLSRSIVEDVLPQFLISGIEGTSEDDDPAHDRRPAVETDERPFAIEPTVTIDVDNLWNSLTRYAAAYSWVELVEPDVLRFHEIVVGPMRDLLRQQPVFTKLNLAFSDYFEQRADEQPEERARHLREAFYHRLILDPPQALTAWREQTRSMRTDPNVAAAMADEIIDLAVRDAGFRSAELVAQARIERALANLRRATAPGAPRGSVLWDLARQDVEQAERMVASAEVRLVACRAALLTRDGAPEEALRLAETELQKPLRPEDEQILHVRKGDAFAAMAAPEADSEYRAAIALGSRVNARPEDLGTLHWKLALALDGRDDIAGARAACGVGLATAPAGTASHAALMVVRGRLAMRLGNPTASVRSTPAPLTRGGRLGHEAMLLLAEAALASWDGDEALRLADGAVTNARQTKADSAEEAIQLAEARELRGNVRGALWDSRGAQEDLESAALIWDSISGPGARRCFEAIARIQLRENADSERAGLALSRAEAAIGDWTVSDRGLVQLRRAELEASVGRGKPEKLVMQTLAELSAGNVAPGVCARAALEGLCLPGAPLCEDFLRAFTKSIAQVKPASARIVMLSDLERLPKLTPAANKELDTLRQILMSEDVLAEVAALPLADRRVALVRLADVARVTGEQGESRRLLDAANALAPDIDRRSLAYRKLALAAVRIGAESLIGELTIEWLAPGPRTKRPALATPWLVETAEELLLGDTRVRGVVAKASAAAERWLDDWGPAGTDLWNRVPRRIRRPTRRPALPEALKPIAPLLPRVRTDYPTINIILRLEDEGVGVWTLPAGTTVPVEYHVSRDENPVVDAIVSANRRPGTLDLGLPDLFADPSRAGSALTKVLLGPYARSLLDRQERVDVRLWTEPGVLGQVPWELARESMRGPLLTADRGVRYFYRGYLDAEYSTPPARPHQASVLIVRPLSDRRESFGVIKTTLVPLERRYDAAGLEVQILESVDLATLVNAVSKHPPDIVHIAAGLVDASGGAAIDVSSGVAGELDVPGIEQDRLTTTALSVVLGAMPPPGPIIVLDPPAVSHFTVLSAQLLLRNAFASEIASLATVPAVIATGLVRYGSEDELYRSLPSALAEGSPVTEVVQGIRALSERVDADSPDAFGFRPTALFASRPTQAVGKGT